ncbi:MAG: GNAT family N-acetyltransferase [Candidatus Thiosymbion ectosymbiont of Robbea hypermnestra]|nr:GNAT family N-acetyltransferase [Candidatus Thiosymbion ectosymbiont of Robbea hypermnestra]
MIECHIEQACSDYAAALIALEQGHWGEDTRPAPPPDTPFFERNPPENTLVAIAEPARVIGYAVLKQRTPFASNAHVLCLRSLVVHREARGQGVGSRLLLAAIDEAYTWGAERLVLTVLGSNEPALRLYRKYGFVVEGRLVQEFRFGTRYVDDIFMALRL